MLLFFGCFTALLLTYHSTKVCRVDTFVMQRIAAHTESGLIVPATDLEGTHFGCTKSLEICSTVGTKPHCPHYAVVASQAATRPRQETPTSVGVYTEYVLDLALHTGGIV